MALVLNDRVKETTTTTGTGTVNLAGAETGFETFVAGIGNTNTTYYAIVHQTADEFEVGLGTVSDSSPDTLSRTTIISSSNSDSGVNFSAGTKDVFCTLPASKTVYKDASGNVGIGTNSPAVAFHMTGNGFKARFDRTGSAGSVVEYANGGTVVGNLGVQSGGFGLGGGFRDPDIFITTAGVVGIGTTSPSETLTVNGNIANTSGDMVVDVVGGIILDADDNGTVSYKDAGTRYGYIEKSSNDMVIQSAISDGDMKFNGNDGGSTITALTLDMSDAGRALFNGSVDIGGTSITRTGDLTLDVSGDIILDADGENIKFLDGGTGRGQIDLGSANFTLRASTSDKDMIFRVNDGGSEIVALTIDASDAGAAIFNNSIRVGESSDANLLVANNGNVVELKAGKDGTDAIDLGFYTQASGGTLAERMRLDSGGNLVATGNITAYGTPSDIKLKENIEVIDNALDKVKQLKGITYDLKSDGNRLTGLIAQDLEKVLPEAVYTAKNLEDEEHLAIRYGNTVGLLVEAIKELEARVKELEGK